VWSTTCHGYAAHYGGLRRRAKGGTLTSSSLQELIRLILKYIYLQQMISIQFAVPSQQLQIINYPKEDLILIIQHQCCKEKDAVSKKRYSSEHEILQHLYNCDKFIFRFAYRTDFNEQS
jgi:hypothetical protein